jgi:hypothetical protein
VKPNLIFWTFFRKICRETSASAKIGQLYQVHDRMTQIHLHCWQQYEILCCSTAVQREPILTFPWQHKAVLILLIPLCRSPTIRRERIVSFPSQLRLCKGTTLLSYIHTVCRVFSALGLHYKVNVINSFINFLKPNAGVKHQLFNIQELLPQCTRVFCIYLRKNIDLCHLHHKLFGFYNWDGKCLLRGTDWVFE